MSSASPGPRFQSCRKLVQKESCHSGTAWKAGPGNHEHLLSSSFHRPMFMDSGLAGCARAPERRLFEFPDNLFRGNDGRGSGATELSVRLLASPASFPQGKDLNSSETVGCQCLAV